MIVYDNVQDEEIVTLVNQCLGDNPPAAAPAAAGAARAGAAAGGANNDLSIVLR
jgi:hypothetical protein